MDEQEPTYRSVSQVNDWTRCPYMFKLKRVDKVWQKPAAWLPQGSAVHEAMEVWEKSGRTLSLEEMQETFRQSYYRFTEELLSETPNLSYWYASGPYTADLDIPRRFDIGLEQTEMYFNYYTVKAPQEVLWVAPDGTPGCELDISANIGDIPVRGYVDEIIVHRFFGPVVVDVKTGNQPGDEFQLATYAVLVNSIYDLEIDVGWYWMGKTGKPTIPYDLTEWPEERIAEVFSQIDSEIRAGLFEPKPEPDKCRFCPVQLSCEYAAV